MRHYVVIIDLILHKFSLIRWNRVSYEQSSNMLREPLVNTSLQECLEVLWIITNLDSVVQLVRYVLVITDKMVHRSVTRLREEFRILRITFLRIPAIYALSNNGPAHIVIRQLAFLDWARSG